MHFKKITTAMLLAVILITSTACGNDISFDKDVYNNENQPVTETPQLTETVEVSGPSGEPASKDYGYSTMFESDLEQFRLPQIGDTVVTLTTNYGDISVLMFPEAAPRTVENFVTHADDDYYDGVIFHRVMNDFMIQGGDPTGTGRGGESIWGGKFEDEFNDHYFPFRGALAMANSGAATNGSQFFIVQTSSYNNQWDTVMADYGFEAAMIEAHKTLGGTAHLFNKHTVFGQVVKGIEVVDAIAAVKVGTADKPVEDVVIEDVVVTIVE